MIRTNNKAVHEDDDQDNDDDDMVGGSHKYILALAVVNATFNEKCGCIVLLTKLAFCLFVCLFVGARVGWLTVNLWIFLSSCVQSILLFQRRKEERNHKVVVVHVQYLDRSNCKERKEVREQMSTTFSQTP